MNAYLQVPTPWRFRATLQGFAQKQKIVVLQPDTWEGVIDDGECRLNKRVTDWLGREPYDGEMEKRMSGVTDLETGNVLLLIDHHPFVRIDKVGLCDNFGHGCNIGFHFGFRIFPIPL